MKKIVISVLLFVSSYLVQAQIQRLIIDSTGQVSYNDAEHLLKSGSATTTPLNSLDSRYICLINGWTRAKRIEVKANFWSDYVLKPDYDLKPLEEVEMFINDNQHLPDVPSEKDVLSNGIDIAAMNAILLQKIEELTLYVIEQDKKIKALETKSSGK